MLNFPMQANGAEMMRLAACLATERGVEVCAPVHDAFLICTPIERIEADVAGMRAAMDEAARAVLDGFPISTEAKIVRYPDRYMDKRGTVMWQQVMRLLAQLRRISKGSRDGRRRIQRREFAGEKTCHRSIPRSRSRGGGGAEFVQLSRRQLAILRRGPSERAGLERVRRIGVVKLEGRRQVDQIHQPTVSPR